ncbi:polyphosphate kinase 1 [Leptothoe sp. ISB3NOV94-8A]|uniref:Polyphosphate kinase n=1 Tax=Adonisia turfae CCMR0081 TaxID=2292702 RepID=A0A6M0RQC4_9CYAN|nr:polyphosphate kinase 1 [Adonisia turfae]MDV3352654.1 polyphosphate kinase 1 [Leptothoe sp. LEGE 181152]NEZ58447.1 polyphosphate kinase 1 [Adonisia turfae CCMR0081]
MLDKSAEKTAPKRSKDDDVNGQAKAVSSDIDLTSPNYYISRELSWLSFNERVLHEALDPRTPMLERLKFLAIFSNNLDEFFMVRVAGIKKQIEAQVSRRTADGRTPMEHLQAIGSKLRPTFARQQDCFLQVRTQLHEHGIYLLDYDDLSSKQVAYLQAYFEDQIFPVLTPLAVDPGHPFPYISNLSLNLAVVVREADSEETHFARIKVPRVLPRFIQLPKSQQPKGALWAAIPLEQVIGQNLAFLFPGMVIEDYYTFRITRNADLFVEEDDADDLMLALEQELRKRRLGGSLVRIELQVNTSPEVRATLLSEMDLTEDDIYDVEGLIGLGDLMKLIGLPLPELKDPDWNAVIPLPWHRINHDETDGEGDDVFSIIRRRDRLVHHPYTSFAATVQQFITQAATDPDVLTIKMTLYRTSGDSPIINALISAAENGKQVVALVELKARFDEENNINWARTLEKAGVHVVYGLLGLKTHTKVALVVRKEHDGIRRYVHIGTGNYNPKTARMYTDLGLLSCSEDLGADLTDLFNYLTGYSRQKAYRQLLIAPITLRERMLALIHQETAHGDKGRIIAKMNSLVDPGIIQALYQASQTGVSIDLIVRGVCCLTPGVKAVSENIRVISIIGRFLEHSRIFYFQNDGNEQFYIGSADWMPRNLDRRVEAVTPILAPHLRRELSNILDICLADNRQAWEMQSDGTYVQRQPQPKEVEKSTHQCLMEQARGVKVY